MLSCIFPICFLIFLSYFISFETLLLLRFLSLIVFHGSKADLTPFLLRSEKQAVFLNFSGISDMREKALDIPDIRGFMRINKLVIALEKNHFNS